MNEYIFDHFSNYTANFFGTNWGEDEDEKASRVKKESAGLMAFTPDHLPLVGPVPGQDGLWLCCGFQGNGMALAYTCAQGMVQMLQAHYTLNRLSDDIFAHTGQRPDSMDYCWVPGYLPATFVVTEKRMQTRLRSAKDR